MNYSSQVSEGDGLDFSGVRNSDLGRALRSEQRGAVRMIDVIQKITSRGKAVADLVQVFLPQQIPACYNQRIVIIEWLVRHCLLQRITTWDYGGFCKRTPQRGAERSRESECAVCRHALFICYWRCRCQTKEPIMGYPSRVLSCTVLSCLHYVIPFHLFPRPLRLWYGEVNADISMFEKKRGTLRKLYVSPLLSVNCRAASLTIKSLTRHQQALLGFLSQNNPTGYESGLVHWLFDVCWSLLSTGRDYDICWSVHDFYKIHVLDVGKSLPWANGIQWYC